MRMAKMCLDGLLLRLNVNESHLGPIGVQQTGHGVNCKLGKSMV